MMKTWCKRALLAPISAWFLLFALLPASAVEIQEVTSKSGIKAWLVEDYTVPIVTVSVSFQGGSVQDPPGKEGLANLISTLFDEGAGNLDSKAFQSRLEKLGTSLSYSDSRDHFSGTMRSLKEDSNEAFDLMRLSLTELRFEENAINRMREALKSQIASDSNDASNKAASALRKSLFRGHPYARSARGSVKTLDGITRDDIVAHFGKLFARDNLTVAVVGAMSADETAAMLDKVFGSLPQKAELVPVPPAQMQFGKRIDVEDSGTQIEISMALPAVTRDSPRFFAAYLMNQILGGGSFSSRLYDEIREKRGLAYSVGSSLSTLDHAAYLTASSGTRADRADETLRLMREEIARMANEGPTQEELDAVKKYVIGSYAINNLDTSGKIANVLISMQTEGLGIDYLDKREELINAVTLDDVKAVARQLLGVEPTIVVVGPAKS
jgi:zinc protease